MSTMETIVALWRWLCGWGVSVIVITFATYFTCSTWHSFVICIADKKYFYRELVLGIVYTIITIVIIMASLFLNGIFI